MFTEKLYDMKSSEYRMGNLLSINSHVGKIVCIDVSEEPASIKIQFLDDKKIELADERFTSVANVKLNSSWLDKFHFGIDSDNKIGTIRYSRNGIKIKVSGGVINYEGSNEEKVIEWVHQLQNSYFEKTGEELPEIHL
jgi:hypothetical protein